MTLTNHNYGQMQHAEYNSKAASYNSATETSASKLPSQVFGKFAALVQQVRTSVEGQFAKQLVVQN